MDPYCLAILAGLGAPLLCSSVPAPSGTLLALSPPSRSESSLEHQLWHEDSANWMNRVDFVVDAGPRIPRLESTVVDLTSIPPTVLREGKGSLDALGEYQRVEDLDQRASS
mmetsp:Transcript_16504/g.33719  ORF Transcript_16504/g.33719 Transcript_16504/m.33719 type:complete len:111 (-) Transcript_16504:1234-1566(-)